MKDKELRRELERAGLLYHRHDNGIEIHKMHDMLAMLRPADEHSVDELRYLKLREAELQDSISEMHKKIRMLYKHLNLTEGLVKSDPNNKS